MSSDPNPQHKNCPTDSDTWCKYNKLALGPIDNIKPESVPRIPAQVGAIIKPALEAPSSDAIFSRC